MTVHKLPTRSAGYRVVARGSKAEIYLYGIIGETWFEEGVGAKQVAEDLKKLGNVKAIDVRINSEGGDVFQGMTIYSLLTQHGAKITVYVDGLAASAASFIAMAGSEINISEAAFMMVHNARGGVWGEADDMRRRADLLDTVTGQIRDIYVARTDKTEAQIKAWMDAETWFTGKEAVENGFATKTVDNLKVAAVAANADRLGFKNTPAVLFPRRAVAAGVLNRLRG